MPPEGPLRDGTTAGFHLIETMRWEPRVGIVRRELHLSRLTRSADELGFALDRNAVEGSLAAIEEHGEPRRVRLLLERGGQHTVTTHPFTPLSPDTVWKLKIAAVRLDSRDPLLRHKSSSRATYEAARAEYSPEQADEVVLLNQDGYVCEGTITNIFVRMEGGMLATPPLECGLLAGVLRSQLLAGGEAREQRLRLDDLNAATELLVGNSLRGLIRARL